MKKKTSQTEDKFNFRGAVKIERIQDFMKQKDLTRDEFAKFCHIEPKELRKVLDNYSVFEPIILLKIAKAMGLEYGDLVN